jgi:hypothetical protein
MKYARIIGLVVAGLLFASAGLFLAQARTAERRIDLAHHVGEIARLDEVLTMSARLYAASHDEQWRERYAQEVSKLDAELAAAVEPASPEARRAVEQTVAGNDALVRMEEASFRLCGAGDWTSAAALLQSAEYQQHKAEYADGMRRALDAIQQEAWRSTVALDAAAVVASVLLILAVALVLRLRRAADASAHALALSQAQSVAMRTTLSTVMDTVNNALNSLTLFRMRAEEGRVSPDDLAQFDDIVSRTSQKLNEMGRLPEFRARAAGTIVMLDLPPAPPGGPGGFP